MKQIKKPTLTIGIPAYNEEYNIGNLLESILTQKTRNYRLEHIYVYFEGSDTTGKIVKEYFKKYPIIKLFQAKIRKGKARGLNFLYKTNTSDYLLTIDADILFVHDNDIEKMITKITSNKKINVVGPRHIPLKPNTLMGKFAHASYLSFEDAFLKLRNGDNAYAIMCVELMRKEFTKSFNLPEGTISDQCYVYAMATQHDDAGFKLVKEASVYFQPVSTFEDWRKLGVRSVIMDKQNVVQLLGKRVLTLYTMPKNLYVKSLIKWFFKSPIYTTGAFLMNLYIRKFPLKAAMPQNGMWTLTNSSKTLGGDK